MRSRSTTEKRAALDSAADRRPELAAASVKKKGARPVPGTQKSSSQVVTQGPGKKGRAGGPPDNETEAKKERQESLDGKGVTITALAAFGEGEEAAGCPPQVIL